MNHNRFRSCGLACQPDEGVLIEFSVQDLLEAQGNIRFECLYQSPDMNKVILDAVFGKMKETGVLNCFDGYRFPELGLFHFRPDTGFSEEDGSAKYQIFQVQLFRSGGYDYAYIVLDELVPGVDLARESIRQDKVYRLRGITVATSVPSPGYQWFNNCNAWYFWSSAPQNFNACVCEV